MNKEKYIYAGYLSKFNRAAKVLDRDGKIKNKKAITPENKGDEK